MVLPEPYRETVTGDGETNELPSVQISRRRVPTDLSSQLRARKGEAAGRSLALGAGSRPRRARAERRRDATDRAYADETERQNTYLENNNGKWLTRRGGYSTTQLIQLIKASLSHSYASIPRNLSKKTTGLFFGFGS